MIRMENTLTIMKREKYKRYEHAIYKKNCHVSPFNIKHLFILNLKKNIHRSCNQEKQTS